jgi:predicted AAA+ superfamily ATPase
MYLRRLNLPPVLEHSFFLGGGRKTGKSTLLGLQFPKAHTIDLLESDAFQRYSQRPQRLREELDALDLQGISPELIIIDEIQKVPALLDEVHWNIERKRRVFGLCGSSARKFRRGHANLLGGRALKFELGPFVSAELGADFS